MISVPQNLYTVSFSKPGYMELGGLSLALGTEVSLSFSTLEDTGTILLAVGGASPLGQQVLFNQCSISTYCNNSKQIFHHSFSSTYCTR